MLIEIWALLQGRKVPIWGSESWRCHRFHQFGWAPHRIRPQIHHPRLADYRFSSVCASAPRVNEALSQIHSDICQDDGFHIELAKDTGLTEVAMNSGGQTRISNIH